MDKFHEQVLCQFAAHGVPASRWELVRNDNIASVTSAISALTGDGYLVVAETSDRHGDIRYALTAKGKAAAGVDEPLSKLRLPNNGKAKRGAK